jgi:hypothetical protein
VNIRSSRRLYVGGRNADHPFFNWFRKDSALIPLDAESVVFWAISFAVRGGYAVPENSHLGLAAMPPIGGESSNEKTSR